MHWVARRNTVSSRPRLTNYDLDVFRKRPMSASIHDGLFMSSHTDLGSPAIVSSSKYLTLKLDFMEEAMSIIIIIIMVIFKCYLFGELIALSYKKKQQQRCEHRIRKNKQIKSTVKMMKICDF